ncbi:pyruvate, phosphate dikinase [Nocardioides marmoriginsengisoli]|uniref:Pyruvate, phosphate dikinase n=1 Tax=Nocardioides marmoriginsengisoli TaxID=661483 RepID=A0A3N0CCP7_9ACTN|nr:pyruvate, phosphate dikinase [Nocardioides marmoriginsengisoli]RNL61079.1 pyruvate, phosphate dikinase [Nocardioides marmoriginsengisoli]
MGVRAAGVTDRTGSGSRRVVHLDGTSELGKDLLGGKAWGINGMRGLGIPVPPAFAVTTDCCQDYFAAGNTLADEVWAEIVGGIAWLEAQTGHAFADASDPLLVSVRSGAAISMPGMMDTVLNLGVNAEVEASLARLTGDPGYAADTHRRFREQYDDIVLGSTGTAPPTDPWEQLRSAVCAVFESWQSPRAQAYRRNRGLGEAAGTAVTVQAMVFGNLDDDSGTGVLFSRNPLTGEAPAYGEWLTRGQGEDVVSGRCDPLPLEELRTRAPAIHDELLGYASRLEQVHRDLQDIEFTVEAGKLWILQCRSAKRSARAALRTAVAMAGEGLITEDEAVRRVSADQARHLLQPHLDDTGAKAPLFAGEPACPGIATGVVVIDPDEAEERGADGEDVVLARVTTSPDDLHGMLGARAIITELGGATSHAAVVSREIHRPCVVGCGAGTVTSLVGKVVTVDGETGRVWAGVLDVVERDEATLADFEQLYRWASRLVPLRVYRPGREPGGVVDLDALGSAWRSGLTAGADVTGAALAEEEGLVAALAAGVASVTVPQALPTLLDLVDLVDAGR